MNKIKPTTKANDTSDDAVYVPALPSLTDFAEYREAVEQQMHLYDRLRPMKAELKLVESLIDRGRFEADVQRSDFSAEVAAARKGEDIEAAQNRLQDRAELSVRRQNLVNRIAIYEAVITQHCIEVVYPAKSRATRCAQDDIVIEVWRTAVVKMLDRCIEFLKSVEAMEILFDQLDEKDLTGGPVVKLFPIPELALYGNLGADGRQGLDAMMGRLAESGLIPAVK